MPINYGILKPLQQDAKMLGGAPAYNTPMRDPNGMNNLLTGLGQLGKAFMPAPQTPVDTAPLDQGMQNTGNNVMSALAQNQPEQAAPGPDGYATNNKNVLFHPEQYLPKDADPSTPQVMQGIAHVESSGSKDPYSSQSIPSKNGDRAYGKYQVMGNNIPTWTHEALGAALTPQQFLKNPLAQEKVAAYQINQSLKQGYTPDDVASIWFSGRPQKQAGNAKDAYGTSVPQYVTKFRQGMQKATPAPTMQMPPQAIPVQSAPVSNFNMPVIQPPANMPIPNMRLANNNNYNVPPPGRPFDRNVPVRTLTPDEIAQIMRFNGTKMPGNGVLG